MMYRGYKIERIDPNANGNWATSGAFLLKCMSMMAECTGNRPMGRERLKSANKESAVISDGYKSKSYDRKRQNKRTCRRAKTFHRQYGRCKFMRGGGRSWRSARNKSCSWTKEYDGNVLLRNRGCRFLPRKRTYLLDRCRNVRWISIRLRIYLLITILEYGKTFIHELPQSGSSM